MPTPLPVGRHHLAQQRIAGRLQANEGEQLLYFLLTFGQLAVARVAAVAEVVRFGQQGNGREEGAKIGLLAQIGL